MYSIYNCMGIIQEVKIYKVLLYQSVWRIFFVHPAQRKFHDTTHRVHLY